MHKVMLVLRKVTKRMAESRDVYLINLELSAPQFSQT